jgi:hypothetical protein
MDSNESSSPSYQVSFPDFLVFFLSHYGFSDSLDILPHTHPVAHLSYRENLART